VAQGVEVSSNPSKAKKKTIEYTYLKEKIGHSEEQILPFKSKGLLAQNPAC
jgi:hypothetical protein